MNQSYLKENAEPGTKTRAELMQEIAEICNISETQYNVGQSFRLNKTGLRKILQELKNGEDQ